MVLKIYMNIDVELKAPPAVLTLLTLRHNVVKVKFANLKFVDNDLVIHPDKAEASIKLHATDAHGFGSFAKRRF